MLTETQVLIAIGLVDPSDQEKARQLVELIDQQAVARWRCPICKAAPGTECIIDGEEVIHHHRRAVFVLGLLRHVEGWGTVRK